MSSVTMSTAVPASVTVLALEALEAATLTMALPCGRTAPSATCRAATAATRLGPAGTRSSVATSR